MSLISSATLPTLLSVAQMASTALPPVEGYPSPQWDRHIKRRMLPGFPCLHAPAKSLPILVWRPLSALTHVCRDTEDVTSREGLGSVVRMLTTFPTHLPMPPVYPASAGLWQTDAG